MKKKECVPIFLIHCFCIAALAQAPKVDDDLQRRLEGLASTHRGKVALFAKHLKTGATVGLEADAVLGTASLIKVALMVETFAQVQTGKHRFDELITMKAEDRVGGSGVLQFLHPGLQVTLEDAVVLMMIESDNTATNLVIDQVPLEAVNKRLAALGLKNTYFYKKVFKPSAGEMPPDQKKFGLGKTTPREISAIFEGIERCRAGEAKEWWVTDQKMGERMVAIMKDQQYPNMLPHYLSRGMGAGAPSVADKLGRLDETRIDAGIVYTRTGPIVMAIFTYDNEDKSWSVENEGELMVGKLARMIVDAWSPASQEKGPAGGGSR